VIPAGRQYDAQFELIEATAVGYSARRISLKILLDAASNGPAASLIDHARWCPRGIPNVQERDKNRARRCYQAFGTADLRADCL